MALPGARGRIRQIGLRHASPRCAIRVRPPRSFQFNWHASGCAHQTCITAVVVTPPGGSLSSRNGMGSELLGRSGCAWLPDSVRCAASALAPGTTSCWPFTTNAVRPSSGYAPGRTNLADFSRPARLRRSRRIDVIDVDGSVCLRRRPSHWTAQQNVARTAPTLAGHLLYSGHRASFHPSRRNTALHHH